MNIVERAITPFNPATNTVQNRDKYNLFAPMAGTNRIGMAGFNAQDFTVNEQIVSISESTKLKLLPRIDVNNIPLEIRYDGPDGIKTPNVWYYNNDGAILVTYKEGVQSEFDVTNNRFRELTIVDGVVTVVGEWLDAPENIIELNHRLRLKFFLGTKNEIESVAEREDDVIYVATDGMPDIEELIYRIGVLEEKLKNCTCGN